MYLAILIAPALAANFTPNTGKWEDAKVYCSAYSGTGGTPRKALESGAQPSMTWRNPMTQELVAMGETEGWETAFSVVQPDDAAGVVAGPYAFQLSPMDRNNDRGAFSGQLAVDLHTLVVGPKMHLDTKGQLIGPWKWNPEEKIEKQLPHVQRATPNAAAWVQTVRQVWAPAAAEAAIKEMWSVFGGAWHGKPVDGPSWETRESPMVGVEVVRTWSNAPSDGCGPEVKGCAALTMEARLADPVAATTAVGTATQTPVPEGVQFHLWSRQVTHVSPKTMQVYAWSQLTFQGQRDTRSDDLEGTASYVSCRPR